MGTIGMKLNGSLDENNGSFYIPVKSTIAEAGI
jgi:hypothetical protein